MSVGLFVCMVASPLVARFTCITEPTPQIAVRVRRGVAAGIEVVALEAERRVRERKPEGRGGVGRPWRRLAERGTVRADKRSFVVTGGARVAIASAAMAAIIESVFFMACLRFVDAPMLIGRVIGSCEISRENR